jgi:3-oxoadipate enol-lactonase
MAIIHANGIDLHYEATGSGPWITMIHALACDLSIWEAQVAALAPHYSVLRFDARGHGDSGAPSGPYTLEQMAGDVIGLLDALRIERTHLVGLSIGGMIAQHVALQAPRRLRSLVLCSTTSGYPPQAQAVLQERIRAVSEQGVEPQVEPTLARWFTDAYRRSHPEVMAHIAALIRATPVAGYLGCCHAIARLDTAARLQQIDVPTLVLVGEQDGGTPPAMAQVIHEAIAGSRMEVIANASHLANIEQANAFNRHLMDFLSN